MTQKNINLVSYKPLKIGGWNVKISYTNMNTFMVVGQSKSNETETFVAFFNSREEMVYFLNFLKNIN